MSFKIPVLLMINQKTLWEVKMSILNLFLLVHPMKDSKAL